MRLAPLVAGLFALHLASPDAAAQAARGGSIRVLTNVDGATVSLDGTDVGVTPLEIKQVRPGDHVVAVRADGHGKREDHVTVEAGSTAVLTLDLEDGGQPGVGQVDPVDQRGRGRGAGGAHAAAGGGGGAPGAGPPGDQGPGGEVGEVADGAPPSKQELLLERRGLSSFGARALPRGRSTIAFGAGYPYLFDSRVQVGALPRGRPFALDAGVLFRTYGVRWELGATTRVTFVDVDPFSFGGFADAGGGSTYFDDSKRNDWFADAGVAASLTGLGAVTITGRAYLDAWTDRHCPGKADEGNPTDLCQGYRDGTLDAETRARVDDLVGRGHLFARDSGVRAMVSLAVEVALSERWSGWLLIEGAPRQDERAAFTDLFHGSMFEEDARSYARFGFAYKF
ncbi:MAG TPA: PEGA domain-containing protein [Kofleriaceae bacterium]|nr:PEGA domain-containing protein [Kofleriaceae bacterium]